MNLKRYLWILGLLGVILVIAVPVVFFWPRTAHTSADPWVNVPEHVAHTNHADIVQGPFASGQEVTQSCLECHENAAEGLMHTVHWTWESEPVAVPGHEDVVMGIGKTNLINNFCIAATGNERTCMTCHAGYGWGEDDSFDFANDLNVDCLACHADTALYAKGEYGNPAEGVDLVAAAQSVRNPGRDNCGKCHFDGGGGNNVKHGDLDESLLFPSENLDVHMGRYDFLCTDCHKTDDHLITGRMLSVSVDEEHQVACTDCHNADLHEDERINAHVATVACQACHIPAIATKNPTKLTWDWSTAGQDLPEDHYTFLKIKGSFLYDKDVQPEYLWYDGGAAYRYLMGDPLATAGPTLLNPPSGAIDEPKARIFPFKVHRARQPYDTVNNYLLPPLTSGEGGLWQTFDWPSALKLGAEANGLDFSGEFDFAETWMYWPTTHMVQPKENALQCENCHGEDGIMDWEALGYPGDPIEWGGRDAAQ
ncbi:MAG: tetrathionate reductase family octaheme c-type cytochrome [Caldilinea sp.]|uniref:tetrathionate reductase family octaheme c-type cytochrome n=1 Tax=Caldilinea sp. TaxID=2293560 RepID=UPI002BCC4ADE|nr:tetrathionate reductase family octaheme c-type cytochrome [Caldilinea sp.]